MGVTRLYGSGQSHPPLGSAELEQLWGRFRRTGLSRRRFFQLLAVGGPTAVLAACGRQEQEKAKKTSESKADEEDRPWVKDPSPFIKHPTNLETRIEQLDGFLTPNHLFFVRNHFPTPRLSAEDYRLKIEGDAVEKPVELSYDEIRSLPSRSLIAYLECAGNWRSFAAKLQGKAASGGQWGRGAVGCASWTGTPLKHALEQAGVKSNAVDVNLIGKDAGGFQRPMPIEKAMDADTLLAYAMNGETLPPDHGFPVRGLVPGWVGSSSVKWLDRIVVSSEKIWVKNNTRSYVKIGDPWPPEDYGQAEGKPVYEQSVKSTLLLEWDAKLKPGTHRLRGIAHSGHGRITKVEWRVDGGAWQEASLIEPVLPHAWVRFELQWEAKRGSHTFEVRATDEAGNTQPESVPFNKKGYLLNMILPHPVEVA